MLKDHCLTSKNVDEILLEYWGLSNANVCKYCGSRQEFSKYYLLSKVGFDTAEYGPLKVGMWLIIQLNSNALNHSPPRVHLSIGSSTAGPSMFQPGSRGRMNIARRKRNGTKLHPSEAPRIWDDVLESRPSGGRSCAPSAMTTLTWVQSSEKFKKKVENTAKIQNTICWLSKIQNF